MLLICSDRTVQNFVMMRCFFYYALVEAAASLIYPNKLKGFLNVYAVFCYLTEFRSQFRFCISRRVNSFEMKRAPSLCEAFSYANVARDSLIALRLIPLRGVEEILFRNIKSWRLMCDVSDISSLCKIYFR